jgi:hypothetical protein
MKSDEMRIGPEVRNWVGKEPKGDCSVCGGQCSPACGFHPAGCVFGGFSNSTSYWMIAEGCNLYHGEVDSNELKEGEK